MLGSRKVMVPNVESDWLAVKRGLGGAHELQFSLASREDLLPSFSSRDRISQSPTSSSTIIQNGKLAPHSRTLKRCRLCSAMRRCALQVSLACERSNSR